MFDTAKKLHKAKKMQSDIKKQLEQIFHSEEKGDSKVTLRGDKRIDTLVIDGEERKDVKDLINSAFKKVDKKAEKKMREQGDVLSMLGLQ